MAWLEACGLDCSRYQSQDDLGMLLAHLCCVPVFLLAYAVLVSFSQRPQGLLRSARRAHSTPAQAAHRGKEVLQVSAALGAVLNALLAKALKASIRQERPSATCALLGVCETYGMPSNHATVRVRAGHQCCCTVTALEEPVSICGS